MKLTLGAPGGRLRPGTVEIRYVRKDAGGALGARLREIGFDGARWGAVTVEVEGRRVVAAGLGPEGVPLDRSVREASFRAAREAARVRALTLVVTIPAVAPAEGPAVLRAAAEGLSAGAYTFARYISDPGRANGAIESALLALARPGAPDERAFARGRAVASAVDLARDLVNEPPSRLDPRSFAREALSAARRAGLRARVLDARALARLGARALLAVAAGSEAPPCAVHLTYRPKGRSVPGRIVLVGKGVTFDSGGLNIKTTPGMASMKSDMAGAAAVLAVMTALSGVGCRHEVHGVLGLAENMTGGRAFKPGDILKTMSGTTVEVTNTDAEGRLVLCDLITWASRTLRPARIVDVATLTGHVVVALGVLASGLFSNDDALAGELTRAADDAGERLWRLPLYDDYLDEMREGPADLKNFGDRWGGAITAALFLREFVPAGIPWAHLDIAGPAFLDSAKGGRPAGATGAAVPTLLRWLEGP